jgi:hypothetical protein
LQKASLAFANLPSLQSGCAVTTPWHFARTDIDCPQSRAKKCALSHAGKCRVEREVSFFLPAAPAPIPLPESIIDLHL